MWGFIEKIINSPPKKRKSTVPLPKGRESYPDIESSFKALATSVEFIVPGFQYEYIPVIRKLLLSNSSVSNAATTLVELGNTGHVLEFGPDTKPEMARKMVKHLDKASKNWVQGGVGIHSIINKFIYQIYIGGCISSEIVLNKDLSGIKYIAFLNAEKIRVAYNGSKDVYEYYQYLGNHLNSMLLKKGLGIPNKEYIKLNPLTYIYYGLFSSEESPIGIPPFLTAMDDLNSQLKMLRNIGYVSDQLGLMGFLEILMAKPDAREGEGDPQYVARLGTLLSDSKSNIKEGLKDGIVAGFKDDHEFNFHSTTKDINGVSEIFNINRQMIGAGLFIPTQFMGHTGSGAETMVNIVFTKMLSQLHNIQLHISEALSKIINTELLLAGFDFDYVKVEFEPSTLTDRLKKAQGREIEIRNSRLLYADGIISQEQYAKEVGYDAPDMKEPRVEIDPNKIAENEAKRKEHEKKSDTSDRRSRDKSKSQPRRKDQNTKPV